MTLHRKIFAPKRNLDDIKEKKWNIFRGHASSKEEENEKKEEKWEIKSKKIQFQTWTKTSNQKALGSYDAGNSIINSWHKRISFNSWHKRISKILFIRSEWKWKLCSLLCYKVLKWVFPLWAMFKCKLC